MQILKLTQKSLFILLSLTLLTLTTSIAKADNSCSTGCHDPVDPTDRDFDPNEHIEEQESILDKLSDKTDAD